MAANARGRGRRPATTIQPIVDWRQVPLLCDAGMTARILGKKYEFVRKKMVDGELPGFKVGAEWFIRKDKLMEHLGYLQWEIERYGYGMAVTQR